ncbi:MAG: DNA polymerase III subunit chi [Thiobacillaceae bacterium]|nr:DNA polymerase III subunit chi [Thiobacillaceae bacterium]MCX7672248.1 DNA polymerase III subunit chi [Thiobacillaceae bacterium]MDW8322843.1 DNA polymerase III subunit chi [Burkholderiales bacterium]
MDFYFNAASRPQVALKLAAKAFQAGQHALLYTTDEAQAAELDRLLWTAQQLSFVPHVRCGHPLAAETPVLIGAQADELASPDVLINLTDAAPPFYRRFARLIEIVGSEEQDRQQARARYRRYQAEGCELHTHDLKQVDGGRPN